MNLEQPRSASHWSRLSPLSRVGAIGLLVVLGVALAITLYPSPVDAGHRSTVAAVLDWLHSIGVPDTFQYVQLEFAANIVMFVPLGLFFALYVSGRWVLALLFPPLLSFVIEMTQYLLLPARFADVSDIIANSLGGWIGVALAAVIVFAARGRRNQGAPKALVRDTHA